MRRAELSQQLIRWLNGALSAEQMSEWAGHAILETENAQPRLPVGEHDFLSQILDECALTVEPQFELTPERTKELLRQLAEAPEPHPGVLWD